MTGPRSMVGIEAAFTLGGASSEDCLILGGEVAEVCDDANAFDLCGPFSAAGDLPYPKVPAAIIRADASVPHILERRSVAQVSKPIVVALAADVVDLVRLGARYQLPNNTMGKVVIVLNRPMQVAIRHPRRQRRLAGHFAIPSIRSPNGGVNSIAKHISGAFAPEQNSRSLFVRKKLAQVFGRGQLLSSHGAVPLRSGQGRALLKQCSRPGFLTTSPSNTQALDDLKLAEAMK